jgi:hypothetical protein
VPRVYTSVENLAQVLANIGTSYNYRLSGACIEQGVAKITLIDHTQTYLWITIEMEPTND